MVSCLTYRNGLNSWYVVVINLLQLISLKLQLLTQSSILSTHRSVHCHNCHPPQQSFPWLFSPPCPPKPLYGPFSGTTRVSRCQKNFWTLWCKGRLTEADTETIRLGDTPQTNQCPPPPSPIFLQAVCPPCRPTNSVNALKATSTFGLGRRC